jgi:isocitrate/isopropylmalate dehydrogenase
MAALRIAVIGGDGIGPEVIDQAIRVADAALRHDKATLEWDRLPWSSAYYKQTGQMMPADGWEVLRRHDAVLLGAPSSASASASSSAAWKRRWAARSRTGPAARASSTAGPRPA